MSVLTLLIAVLTICAAFATAAAARDPPAEEVPERTNSADAAAPSAASALETSRTADADIATGDTATGHDSPPLEPQKVANSLQKRLEGHLDCADWAVLMGGWGGGPSVTGFSVNKGYDFWNPVNGQPFDSYDYICSSISTAPQLFSGTNARPVIVSMHSQLLGAYFWRKKGTQPKLTDAEVRDMVLRAADKCQAGKDFMSCTFDDILATDEAPLAGVYAMWPPTSLNFALSGPSEVGLVQVPYTYRLPGKPTPMLFIAQSM